MSNDKPIVVVVDDTEESRLDYVFKLVRVGFRVLEAEGAVSFRRVLREHRDEIVWIICDTNLNPGEPKGYDLCEEARNSGLLRKGINVRGVSARGDYDGFWREKGFEFSSRHDFMREDIGEITMARYASDFNNARESK